MNKGLISIAISALCAKYGDKGGIKRAKELGAEAIDFSLLSRELYNCAVPESIYAKSDEEILTYYASIKAKADELGLAVSDSGLALPCGSSVRVTFDKK